MIRALLAAALAAALLAASLPAVESAAADRTAAALGRDIDRIERASESLLADDDPGARRVVTISLPANSLSSAGVDWFTVDCQRRCTARYRLEDAKSGSRRLTLPLTTPDGPVRLARAGEHRLRLRLAETDGARVIQLRG